MDRKLESAKAQPRRSILTFLGFSTGIGESRPQEVDFEHSRASAPESGKTDSRNSILTIFGLGSGRSWLVGEAEFAYI